MNNLNLHPWQTKAIQQMNRALRKGLTQSGIHVVMGTTVTGKTSMMNSILREMEEKKRQEEAREHINKLLDNF